MWTSALFGAKNLQFFEIMAKNFDWGGGGGKMENFCDVILVMFFGDIMTITSLK